MQQHFTLQYWPEGDELVGRVKELPGLVVQGRDLAELDLHTADACRAMATHQSRAAAGDVKETRITVETFATLTGRRPT